MIKDTEGGDYSIVFGSHIPQSSNVAKPRVTCNFLTLLDYMCTMYHSYILENMHDDIKGGMCALILQVVHFIETLSSFEICFVIYYDICHDKSQINQLFPMS